MTSVRRMISYKNKPYPECNAFLPECTSCIVSYKIWECACYEMTFPDPMQKDSCKTCRVYKSMGKRHEPTTKPKIEGHILRFPKHCGESKCAERVRLPFCGSKRECITQITGYHCACISIRLDSSCGGCRTPQDVDSSDFTPTTRAVIVFRPHWSNTQEIITCDKCKILDARRIRPEDVHRRGAKERRAQQERLQQDNDDAQDRLEEEDKKRTFQKLSGRQAQYYGQPEHRPSINIPDATYRRPHDVRPYQQASPPHKRHEDAGVYETLRSKNQSPINIPDATYRRPHDIKPYQQASPPYKRHEDAGVYETLRSKNQSPINIPDATYRRPHDIKPYQQASPPYKRHEDAGVYETLRSKNQSPTNISDATYRRPQNVQPHQQAPPSPYIWQDVQGHQQWPLGTHFPPAPIATPSWGPAPQPVIPQADPGRRQWERDQTQARQETHAATRARSKEEIRSTGTSGKRGKANGRREKDISQKDSSSTKHSSKKHTSKSAVKPTSEQSHSKKDHYSRSDRRGKSYTEESEEEERGRSLHR